MRNFLYAVFFLLLLLNSNLSAKKKDIFVIESYHQDYIWSTNYRNAIKEELGSQYNLTFFYMDTKRLPVSKHQESAQKAWNMYKDLNPELVILGDDNALKYLGPKLSKTKTNVVYLGINNNPRKYFNYIRTKNITGVLERPLLRRSIFYVKELLDVKKVLLLFDSGISSQVIFTEVFRKKSKLVLRDVEVNVLLVEKFDIWKKAILDAKRNDYDAIVISSYHTIKDKDDKHVRPSKIWEWTSKNITVPPFAFWNFAVGKNKAIGGYVISGREQGLEASKLVLEILEDENYTIGFPSVVEKGYLLFSETQVKKWGISLKKLDTKKIKLVK